MFDYFVMPETFAGFEFFFGFNDIFDFGNGGRFQNLSALSLRKTDAPDQFIVARVAAQRIKTWVAADIRNL